MARFPQQLDNQDLEVLIEGYQRRIERAREWLVDGVSATLGRAPAETARPAKQHRLSAAGRAAIAAAQRQRWAAQKAAAVAAEASPAPKKRVFTVAARKRMAAAQKRRWAAKNKE